MLDVSAVQKLPKKPSINTVLFLRRLERQGVTSIKKLSASHWETINRFEAAAVSAPELRITRRAA